MNQFGDLTVDEYRFFFSGLRSHFSNETEREGSSFLPPSGVSLPPTVDWRTKGYVTPVKDQGQCGSCWAFSTIGSLEGQHFKKTGKLVSLSEQNLVDCSTAYDNHGCRSGKVDNAFNQCSQTQLGHAVLAVGYGTYQGQDYWLVKNSWATSWGMQGYIMMSRNKNNQCGIASKASYPFV